MSEPRKPIFGFLWPAPDPDAPVDGAYRQVRRVRVTSRGPIRVGVLAVLTLVLVASTGTLVMTAVAVGVTVVTVLGAAVSATLLVLVLRGWVVGTYVNDQGVSIETTWRRLVVAWPDVTAVTCDEQRVPWLGIPVGVSGPRSCIHTSDGRDLPTHVYATSPDLWLRPEAFDIARIRLEQWLPPRS